MKTFDFAIVGAGIVGLTTALEILTRQPGARLAILEKEAAAGLHASGRNSGVLHCGIYYESGSLKAMVCARGGRRMVEFAEEEGISINRCGKVILATSETQLPTLEKLMRNALDNGIPAERIDDRQLLEIEPYAAQGGAAIHCPTTAVIDSAEVVRHLMEMLERRGVEFFFDCPFQAWLGGGRARTKQGIVGYGFLINCAGAHADTIARNYGVARDYSTVPFKGIYWKLGPSANVKVRANIYPVPDTSVPFLGVHLTRVISGEVYAGPTAIPALGRENYGIVQGANLIEAGAMGYRLARMYLRNENNFRNLVHAEIGKYSKRNFFAAARKLLPSLSMDDLVPSKKAGIRPQLVNDRTGRLEMDYVLVDAPESLHVLNAISPAFTSSMAFSELIVDRALAAR